MTFYCLRNLESPFEQTHRKEVKMVRLALIVIALTVVIGMSAQIVSTSDPVIQQTTEVKGNSVVGYRHVDSGLMFIPTAFTLPQGMFQASTLA